MVWELKRRGAGVFLWMGKRRVFVVGSTVILALLDAQAESLRRIADALPLWQQVADFRVTLDGVAPTAERIRVVMAATDDTQLQSCRVSQDGRWPNLQEQ